jgi:hypothetical protein
MAILHQTEKKAMVFSHPFHFYINTCYNSIF